jgi:cell division septation protein DedD
MSNRVKLPAILMSDEGVHGIQLNGKQLVFMFMAVTVVAVVIFLCGVMVGRGVRAPRATELADTAIEVPLDPTAALTAPAPSSTESPSPTAPDPSQEPTLSYSGRLSATTPPPETLKDPVPLVQELKATAPAPAPAKAPEPPPAAAAVKTAPPAAAAVKTPPAQTARTSKPAASPVSEPAGAGYVVQVAAVKERGEADTIAKRLQSKGFPSFVSSPGAGAARVYRVRVGKYNDRREAETVARRLEKEEQFKPWITR